MTANSAGVISHPVTPAGEPAVRSPAVQSPAVGARAALAAPGTGPGPQVAPGPADELPGGQCTRCGAVGTHYLTCGAVGTHYLTCPGLRLPSGFRLS
jgi:hypothetical protein